MLAEVLPGAKTLKKLAAADGVAASAAVRLNCPPKKRAVAALTYPLRKHGEEVLTLREIFLVGPVGLEPTTNGFRLVCVSTLSGLCLQPGVAAVAVCRQVSTPSLWGAWLGVGFSVTCSAFTDFDTIHMGGFPSQCTLRENESAALTIELRARTYILSLPHAARVPFAATTYGRTHPVPRRRWACRTVRSTAPPSASRASARPERSCRCAGR